MGTRGEKDLKKKVERWVHRYVGKGTPEPASEERKWSWSDDPGIKPENQRLLRREGRWWWPV